MKEAEALLRKGLGLVHNTADGAVRQRQELGLQICLGQALFATQGWAAAGVGEAYARARELCRQLDQPQKMLPILYGQWINHAMRGEMDRAQQLAGEIRQPGGDRGDRIADLIGSWSGGFTSPRCTSAILPMHATTLRKVLGFSIRPKGANIYSSPRSTRWCFCRHSCRWRRPASDSSIGHARAVIWELPKRADSRMPTHWLLRCTSVSERAGPDASIRQLCCRKLRSF